VKRKCKSGKALPLVVFVVLVLFGLAGHAAAQTVTLISDDPGLTNPGAITTDGVKLYIGNGDSIFSVPIGGGAATTLYADATPCCVTGLTRIGTNLFWIDPNGDPDATAIFRGSSTGGPVTKIYSGFATGQPIVDGVGITTDGVKLYTTDYVQGRVHSLNPDGSAITFLGSRYGGFFDLEHLNTLAESGGILYIADDGSKATSGILPQVVSIPTTGGSFTTLHLGAPFVCPSGITVGDGAVFVADACANTIWSLPTTGGTPTALVSGAPFVQIIGLTFFNHTLYVTDSGNVGSTDGPGKVYKVIPPLAVSLTSTPPSPQPVGTTIVSTAVATGGTAPRFRFWVQPPGGAFTLAQDYSPSNSFSWTPSVAGTNVVCVWARSSGSSAAKEADACQAFQVTTPSVPAVTSVSLTPDKPSPQPIVTPVFWTATVTGGTAPRFRFWVQPPGGAFTLAQDYSANPTFLWTPSVAGTNVVCVWARSSGSSAAEEADACQAFQVTTPGGPVTSVSLNATPPSPQPAGTLIAWTAVTTGSTAPRFRFWVQPPGGAFTLAQDYSANPTFLWTPSVAGTNVVCVWARSSGSSAAEEADACQAFQVN